MVRLKNKEEELARAKKTIVELQEQFTKKFSQLKHDYDVTAAQELKKFYEQFELEKSYFHKIIEEKDKTYQESITNIQSTISLNQSSFGVVGGGGQSLGLIQERLNQVEEEKKQINKELQAYIFKYKALERDFQKQLDLGIKEAQFNSVPQSEYDSMREKLTTKFNEANEKLNKIETRIAILQ